MSERRRYRRTPFSGSLRYRILDDEATQTPAAEGAAADLCINGVSFLIAEPLEEGTMLALSMHAEAEGLEALERDAVVVGCTETAGDKHRVSCRFTSGDEEEVVSLLLLLYSRGAHDQEPPLSQLAMMCGPEDLERWPFFREGLDCWETERAPCGPHTLDECACCPIAALAFLMWEETPPDTEETASATTQNAEGDQA